MQPAASHKYFGSSFWSVRMAGLLRLVGPELARGVSTALALFSHRCGDCVCSPQLTCPEVVKCPDCVCQGSSRQCASCPLNDRPASPPIAWLLVAWLLGVLTGVAIYRWATQVPVGVEREVIIEEPRVSAAAVAAARRRALAEK